MEDARDVRVLKTNREGEQANCQCEVIYVPREFP